MNEFYKYIHKVGKGYQIRKDNVGYGYYERLTDALYDRDDLVACGWDIEEWVWIQPHPNKYENMELPVWSHSNDLQYIYRNGDGWKIQRRNKYYGQYNSLEEAIKMRNKLMRSEWK